jgi:endonuclease/exonuclease/phosphatase family metal-dependent hydrolase
LKFHEADIFCLQEALLDQLKDIDSAFPTFSYVGVGRDDGLNSGEFAPIFYNTLRFRENTSGHFWLSEHPETPGLGWDAAYNRICTWLKLEEKATGKKLIVFNTHFDNVGVEARINAADLIIKKIKIISDGKPVILCGDFNLGPESIPIHNLSTYLRDSYSITKLPPFGSETTFSGFSFDDEPGDRIDYIFVSEGIEVKRYAALTDSRNRKFFSDHLPVFVEVSY